MACSDGVAAIRKPPEKWVPRPIPARDGRGQCAEQGVAAGGDVDDEFRVPWAKHSVACTTPAPPRRRRHHHRLRNNAAARRPRPVPNLNSVEPVRRRHDPARPLGSHHARRHRIRRPPGLHHPGKAVRRLHLTKRARYRRAIIGNSPRSRGGHSRVRPVRHHGVLLRLPFLQGAVAGGPRQSRRAHRLVGTLNLARDHMFSAQTGHHHGDG